MGTVLSDLRYGARALAKAPAFTLTALLTLGLGIGASTAIFSVVNAVLLRPLPYAEADRLVLVWQDLRARNVVDWPLAPADFPELRALSGVFEELSAVSTSRESIAGDDREPEQIRVANVTTNFLPMLGATMIAGRGFEESDGVPPPNPNPPQAGGAPAPRTAGGNAAADRAAAAAVPPSLPLMGILSHGFWQRRFGADHGVIGRTVPFGGGSVQIVGVLAPGVELLFPPGTNIERAPDVWTALRIDYATASRVNVFMRAVGRLRPGVSVQRAQAQVDTVAADLRQRFPIKQTSGMHFRVEPMQDDLVADVRPAVLTLMGAVLFVLLIACANVANLLLVRMSSRTRDLAVRAALGGSRRRLVRQMLIESLLLALGGAALGLAVAQIGIDLLMLLRPDTLPRLDDVAIDPYVFAFAIAAALAAALLFGLLPAWRASRPDLMEVLRTSGRTAALGGGGHVVRNGVVMLEVALAFVLLIGSGLMVRSFVALQRVNPGYDANGLLTFSVQPQGPRYDTPAARAAFIQQLRDRLRALPGVTMVTAANQLPLEGFMPSIRWGREEALADPTRFQQAHISFVLPGYFDTLRTPVLAGRTFTEADNVPDLRRIVVDRRLAQKAFPGEPAVGKQIVARLRTNEPERFEIIGVVEHQRSVSLAAEGREAIYFADGFTGHANVPRWAVRTAGTSDPERLAAAVRAEVRQLDARLPVAEVQPMSAFVDRAQAPTRFALVLIGLFAGIAAVLAAIGLYGVLSTMVRQRTAEIGVRMAFGAAPGSIFRQMVGHGLLLSAVGIAVGIVAAFALTGVMRTMLVGVEPTDPTTFLSIAALFLTIAAFASWLPARRAARLDPTGALRE